MVSLPPKYIYIYIYVGISYISGVDTYYVCYIWCIYINDSRASAGQLLAAEVNGADGDPADGELNQSCISKGV